ncbi:MAG TPA: extracellular solute-binding protein [Solirubrobacteraceae bacterium]|jgi:multiple sugar transport system substrate-binding protein|nr:extracellular solute-binding protein [Solirubrobacteraceae bacterium]
MRIGLRGLRRGGVALLSCAAAAGVAACGGASSGANAASPSSGNAKVIKVAYGSTYVFDTTQLTTKWWNQVAQQFEAQNPGIKVQLVPIPGSYNDIVNKLSLLYRSPSTAPDVAEIPTGQIGLWQSSGYLRPLDSYLAGSSWWSKFPPVVQSEGTFGGKVYAVDQGENDSALLYNKTMFRKAGLPVPWKPKNWNDILVAARKIKAAVPGVVPLWLNAGSGSGANGLLQGINNFIVGSSTPKIQDGNKWVVDSPGIRNSFSFMKQVYSGGLGADQTALFSPNAVTTPLTMFAQGKLAMAVGSNYYTGNWTKAIGAPYWPQAAQTMGVAPIPTENGQGIASTLGGWDYAISAHSGNPSAAFKLINVMESEQNSIDAANWAGWVTPNRAYWSSPLFTKFAPYQQLFAQILPHATLTPSSSNYSIWVQGMGNATGSLVQNPNTSASSAVGTLSSYVSNQVPGATEKLP